MRAPVGFWRDWLVAYSQLGEVAHCGPSAHSGGGLLLFALLLFSFFVTMGFKSFTDYWLGIWVREVRMRDEVDPGGGNERSSLTVAMLG